MFTDSIWETEEHVFTNVGENIVYVSKLTIKVNVWEKIRKVSNLAHCQLTLLQLQVQEYS